MIFPIISLYLVDSNLLQAAYIMKVFLFVLQMWGKDSLGTERQGQREQRDPEEMQRVLISQTEPRRAMVSPWCCIRNYDVPFGTRETHELPRDFSMQSFARQVQRIMTNSQYQYLT